MTFHTQSSTPYTLIDERAGIGPHHLAIGKTRKLFERDGTIYAFFSRGYEIACAVLDAASLKLRNVQSLNVPVAWGGGAFCVDCDSSGRVALVFLHRNQHELCLATGRVENGQITWAPWRALLVSSSYQAAPWLELGADGTAWCSVLDRAGDFRLAIVRNGETRVGNLFTEQEDPWYHSCVQVLPFSDDKAVAIGFRGAFPARTELVFKNVSAQLELGPSETLAPCNVNDRLTFHFQAVGDPERGCAHIVYLDEGLAVSHARFSEGQWIIARRVIAVPSYAPQICVNARGDLFLLAADYDGRIWRATRPFAGEWSEPAILTGIPGPNISSLFAQTGYGTGGLISAARSDSGRVPFLMADITDERTAKAELRLSDVGGRAQVLAPRSPLIVKEKGRAIDVEIRLAGLSRSDLTNRANSWLVNIPAQKSRVLKIRITAGNTVAATASWQEADGRTVPMTAHAAIETSTCDAFSSACYGTIRAVLEPEHADAALQLDRAWVETYSGDSLVDLAPYQRETAAKLALAPDLITRTYKRMV
jgi:hypothetical protein